MDGELGGVVGVLVVGGVRRRNALKQKERGMSEGRFIIEGEWSGYQSSQQRVVHRTVHKGNWKKLRSGQRRHMQLDTPMGLHCALRCGIASHANEFKKFTGTIV